MSSMAWMKKKWANYTAHHNANLKCLPLGGIVFNGKFHEGWIEVFHYDFSTLAKEVEKVEGHLDYVVRNWTVCSGKIKSDYM